jgi:magnesium-protoporphyrin IX monomethyl ester (oxidative) cyclase
MKKKHLKKINKITFLQPPALLAYQASKTVWPPLGILYLVAAAVRSSFDVQFIDAILEGFDNNAQYSENAYIMGLSPEETAKRVLETAPDMLAISLQFENQIELFLQIIALIKAATPDCFIIVGGPIVTLKPQKIMRIPYVDGIILGEGDYKLINFILNLNKGWPTHLEGCGIKLDENTHFDEQSEGIHNLDDLPFPARDHANMQKYFRAVEKFKMLPKRKKATTILSSRGCPERCCFCASPVLYKRRYQIRSAINVIDEIDELIQKYGVEEFIFFDENFAASRKRTIQLLDLMIERNYGINWYCSQGFALWTIDDEIIEKLALSGCYKVKFSVESGSQRVLREIIHKRVDLSKVLHTIERCKDFGLVTGVNFILGFPGETREELEETYNFAKLLDADFTIFNIAMPYPQTELCKRAKELGYLPPDFDFDALNPGIAHMNLPQFTSEELEYWYHKFWLDLNFSTQEKEKRYYRYAIKNPNYIPIEKQNINSSINHSS